MNYFSPLASKLIPVYEDDLNYSDGYKLPCSPNHPGGFLAKRKFQYHTRVDLYCDSGTPVYAIKSGLVVNILPFTGPKAGSNWWHDTQAVLVQGDSGVLLYGEINVEVQIGQEITCGDRIGTVEQVLRVNKGRPCSMLHIELLEHGSTEIQDYYFNDPAPQGLLDPTTLLMQAEDK